MVYDNVWKQTPHARQYHRGRVYAVLYRSPRTEDPPDRAYWGLASEQTFSEGLEQSVQHLVWHFDLLLTAVLGRISMEPLNTAPALEKAHGCQLQLANSGFVGRPGEGYYLTDDWLGRLRDVCGL